MFDFDMGHLYGLEKFWAFLKYSGHNKNDVNKDLQLALKPYKCLEDFRVLVSIWAFSWDLFPTFFRNHPSRTKIGIFRKFLTAFSFFL